MIVNKMPDLVLALFSFGDTPLVNLNAYNMLYFASSLFTSYLPTSQFFYEASFSGTELIVFYVSAAMCSYMYSSCLKNPRISARFCLLWLYFSKSALVFFCLSP